ncbi:MAG: patatin [Hydrogenophaga sp. SCN 70-13]|uniref:patatin-like phospholipase family protein n=1 Tax=unclassified Hydrogenophaga TaxID=2610897 RepID=UPI000869B393|nr:MULTISPECIES: patatin-like phospholipase family protein [unclassified Hydrogenophaga]MBN9370747.1 patatin-like phospholipase family protein [Hydrogenophaga sp.]ODT33628.1 MAG: patatin [Hydrogenophaga sp. SCN 70-13]OJV54488.1 MAG: patatin [Hydrogenophaga sp. 70-12]
MSKPAVPANKTPIDLALQGGGSHGAFTWGVLDRLLEDPSLRLTGISGTSAGAMNAVALASGLMEGGRDGARAALRRFWTRVGEINPFGGLESAPAAPWLDPDSPWAAPWLGPVRSYAQWLSTQASPYQLNPLNLNPLRDILRDTVDFDRVRACHRTQLFIAATRVKTGELRIFRQHELSADVILASACLPLLFQAVEIDGEAYWDGGYAGNPSLLPLLESPGDDLLLVQINPAAREALPVRANEILDRINEVTFNASLIKELRSIALLKELLAAEGWVARQLRSPVFRRIAALRLHRVDGGAELAALGAGSKTRTDPAFLERLFQQGRGAAETWLARHRADLGVRGTLALEPDAGGGTGRAAVP